jgi:hypothetical protein
MDVRAKKGQAFLYSLYNKIRDKGKIVSAGD